MVVLGMNCDSIICHLFVHRYVYYLQLRRNRTEDIMKKQQHAEKYKIRLKSCIQIYLFTCFKVFI